MEIKIRSLSEDTLEDFLYFFDNVAFADNPDWSGCYCMFFYNPGTVEDFESKQGERNRMDVVDLISQGIMKGYIAYYGGKPVGWCNINRKTAFPFLLRDERLLSPEDDKCTSITCFVTAQELRRRGIARALVEHILEDRLHGEATLLEAYPRNTAKRDAEHYYGPLQLYLDAGFSIHKTLEEYSIVRKRLS